MSRRALLSLADLFLQHVAENAICHAAHTTPYWNECVSSRQSVDSLTRPRDRACVRAYARARVCDEPVQNATLLIAMRLRTMQRDVVVDGTSHGLVGGQSWPNPAASDVRAAAFCSHVHLSQTPSVSLRSCLPSMLHRLRCSEADLQDEDMQTHTSAQSAATHVWRARRRSRR